MALGSFHRTPAGVLVEVVSLNEKTSTPDGMPHNSPVNIAYDEKGNFYWASGVDAQHSQNIANNPNVFIAIFDSNVSSSIKEGAYILAVARMLTTPEEVLPALWALSHRANGRPPSEAALGRYSGDSPRRIYMAVPEKLWVSRRQVVKGEPVDIRREVGLPDVFGPSM